VRRWLHEIGWGWHRATLAAHEDAPHRIERLARLRLHHDRVQAHAVMVCADARDMHLLPTGGVAWMPPGTPAEVMTPGKHEKPSLAGALQLATGTLLSCRGPRKNTGWFRDLLTLLDTTSPASGGTRLYVVADTSCRPKAKAVEPWLAHHPRLTLLWLPTYCPRAHPIERAFGDGHDTCTRNHKRQR
jgi:DDE superfamily endonuclease